MSGVQPMVNKLVCITIQDLMTKAMGKLIGMVEKNEAGWINSHTFYTKYAMEELQVMNEFGSFVPWGKGALVKADFDATIWKSPNSWSKSSRTVKPGDMFLQSGPPIKRNGTWMIPIDGGAVEAQFFSSCVPETKLTHKKRLAISIPGSWECFYGVFFMESFHDGIS